MGQHDFEVDLVGLAKAAQAAAEAVQMYKDKDVSDHVPSKGDLGNDTVWDAVDEFQDRWERGVNTLCEDISEVAGRLGGVARTYIDFDSESEAAFTAIAPDLANLMQVEAGP